MDDSHSDDMVLADDSDALDFSRLWKARVSSPKTVPRDAEQFDGIRMTPVSTTVTVPRYARDLDGVSPASLHLLLRGSAAPAFIGEGPSLVLNPTHFRLIQIGVRLIQI